MNRYNISFANKISDTESSVYLVGQLTRDIPFLISTEKRALISPFLIETEKGELSAMNNGKPVIIKDGKLQEVEIPPRPTNPTWKALRIPSIAVNEDNGRVSYYNLVAFAENATALFRVKQGDTIVVYGILKNTCVPGIVGAVEAVWVKDIRIIRQSNRTKSLLAESVE